MTIRNLIWLVLLSFWGAANWGVGPALAQVKSGTIYEVRDDAGADLGSTVDYWHFQVNSTGNVSIDIRSWEVDAYDIVDNDGDFTETFDLNGDGEIAFFDSMIYLFHDDGSLDAGDLVDMNDDNIGTFNDGSLNVSDSYLNLVLNSGPYVLAVGAYDFALSEAVSGVNDAAAFPATADGLGNLLESDHGDYQITWIGNVSVAPEPASFALASMVGGMLLLVRRRAAGGR